MGALWVLRKKAQEASVRTFGGERGQWGERFWGLWGVWWRGTRGRKEGVWK